MRESGGRDLDLELEEYEEELEREFAAAEDDLADLADEAYDEDDRDAAVAAGGRDLADEVIDQLLPERVDWRRLVREHPWPAVGLAAVGGYILGRTRGKAVIAALSAFAAGAVADGVNEALGEDIL